MKTLQDILNQRSLSALFQPIMEISGGTFLGFEGLIRGPADSPLHSPINLFAAAKQQGLSLEVEMLLRDIGIACGQGYFIARPNSIPPLNPPAEVGCLVNTQLDFIGHIGGDDFILVMQSADWEKRCRHALASFAQTSMMLLEEHRSIGGYSSETAKGALSTIRRLRFRLA